MKLIKDDTHFDFLGKRKISLSVSSLLIVLGFAGYFLMGGFKYGIDFSGGTLVQVQINESHDISDVRAVLEDGNVGPFSLQSFGEEGASEYLIILQEAQSQTGDGEKTSAGARVNKVLKEHFPSLAIRRVESVGPKVGEELKTAATIAVLASLAAIMLYIWLRFQWRYSIGALIALFHDVLLVLAVFALTQKEISLPVVAAVLTVAGYSINDTIVIFDRIRESLRRYQKRDLLDSFNLSLNQTLSRTVLTSATTLFVVLSLYIFGGEIINNFAFALLLGVIVGTYSSVFVAAPMVFILLKRFPAKLR